MRGSAALPLGQAVYSLRSGETGLYLSAEDWFARTGAGSYGGREESGTGTEERSRGKGHEMAVPKGAKDSGVRGSGVMRREGGRLVSVGAGIFFLYLYCMYGDVVRPWQLLLKGWMWRINVTAMRDGEWWRNCSRDESQLVVMVVGAGLSVPRSLRDKIRSVGAAEDGERSMPIRVSGYAFAPGEVLTVSCPRLRKKAS